MYIANMLKITNCEESLICLSKVPVISLWQDWLIPASLHFSKWCAVVFFASFKFEWLQNLNPKYQLRSTAMSHCLRIKFTEETSTLPPLCSLKNKRLT